MRTTLKLGSLLLFIVFSGSVLAQEPFVPATVEDSIIRQASQLNEVAEPSLNEDEKASPVIALVCTGLFADFAGKAYEQEQIQGARCIEKMDEAQVFTINDEFETACTTFFAAEIKKKSSQNGQADRVSLEGAEAKLSKVFSEIFEKNKPQNCAAGRDA